MTAKLRPAHPGIQFLASVTNETEARLALAGGVDIVDCKDPKSGTLGALPPAVIGRIRAAVPPSIAVSATIGDVPCEPDAVASAVRQASLTGADIVKIGMFPGGDPAATLRRLGALDLGEVSLVGLLLADREPDFGLMVGMRDAGFAGVMLDTAGKSAGSLVDYLSLTELRTFVGRAHALGLFAGLAGSIGLGHVPALAAFHPDVMGFRGALCRGGARTQALEPSAIGGVRRAIDLANRAAGRAPARESLDA